MAIRERHHVAPCSCGGRRWVIDDNSSDPERRERTQGDGLIPCGSCNHGGWETPLNAPTEPQCDEDFQPWPCDAIRLLDELDAAWAVIERAGP